MKPEHLKGGGGVFSTHANHFIESFFFLSFFFFFLHGIFLHVPLRTCYRRAEAVPVTPPELRVSTSIPIHCRGVGLSDLLGFLPTQTTL